MQYEYIIKHQWYQIRPPLPQIKFYLLLATLRGFWASRGDGAEEAAPWEDAICILQAAAAAAAAAVRDCGTGVASALGTWSWTPPVWDVLIELKVDQLQ